MSGRALYAEDVADLMGVSVDIARRLLRFVRKRYGDTVVGEAPSKRGTRLWTTHRSWGAVMPSLRRANRDIYDRVSRLEEEVRLLKDNRQPRQGV